MMPVGSRRLIEQATDPLAQMKRRGTRGSLLNCVDFWSRKNAFAHVLITVYGTGVKSTSRLIPALSLPALKGSPVCTPAWVSNCTQRARFSAFLLRGTLLLTFIPSFISYFLRGGEPFEPSRLFLNLQLKPRSYFFVVKDRIYLISVSLDVKLLNKN